MSKRYCLTNYCVHCTDTTSGADGCFLFDTEYYKKSGKFKAVGGVYADLAEFFEKVPAGMRVPGYIEFEGRDK